MTTAEVTGAERPTADDHAFQERYWRFQRVAWLALALFILAALAGLTGRGGALARDVANAGPARIDYPAVSRVQTGDHLRVSLPGTATRAEVLLPASLVDRFMIERVIPQPAEVAATPAGVRYVFVTDAGRGPVNARFDIRAIRSALPAAVHRVTVNGVPATLRVLILP